MRERNILDHRPHPPGHVRPGQSTLHNRLVYNTPGTKRFGRIDTVMPKMVSRNPIKRKREEKRLAKLQKEGRLVKGIEIPKNALAANPDAQNHQGGYSEKFFYQDIHYTCAGCGRPGVWTAQQQKKYFEVQKGNIYNAPKWCYKCHSSRIKDKEAKAKHA